MALRAAELEVLFTADTNQVTNAEKDVQTIGRRIESKPITQKIDADAKGAVASASRVENAFEVAFKRAADSSKGMSSSLVRDFLESGRASGKSADEIQRTLVKSYGVAEAAARDLALATKGELKIKADPSDAIASMRRVEEAARQLVSQSTALKLDADIGRAEKSLERAKQRLDDLKVRALGGLDVAADTRRAEAALQKVERNLAGLQAAKNQIRVDADPAPAESRLNRFFARFRRDAEEAGTSGGRSFTEGLDSATRGAGQKVGEVVGGDIEGTLVAALAAIPVAGGIVLGAVAIGKSIVGGIQDGLQVEVSNDRLQGLTGISEADALRLGRAAGEAYTRVFGESVEANMDTARIALQNNLIDEDTATRGAQRTIEGLSGIADALGDDVKRVAAATAVSVKSGIVPSAQAAFDLFATGAREGVNRSEDLLDTFTEYPALFKRLGLSGEQALGLLNQGLGAGARNSDLVADSLKEFQIRGQVLTDSAEGYKILGLNVDEYNAKVAAGGNSARDALSDVLDRLRKTEDPVLRNAAAVSLFGTQAEDLGESLFALDLSTAVDQLDGVTGSAQRMFDTLASNDSNKIESARRNIEVAADGIKGALAAAFSEPIGDAAEYIASNRGPLLQFFLDLANGAIDFGESMVNSAADGTEALGAFISGPGVQILDTLIAIQGIINPLADQTSLFDLRDTLLAADDASEITADKIRDRLLPAIGDARDRLNEFGDGAVAMGFLNDASMRLATSLDEVGVNADGSAASLEGIDTANIRASESGRILEGQVRAAIAALKDELDAAAAAGEGQDLLSDRYENATGILMNQLTQMGLNEEQARALIDTVLQTPATANTEFGSNAVEEQAKVQDLANRVTTLPDGSISVYADTSPAAIALQEFLNRWNGASVNLRATGSSQLGSGILGQAAGGVVEFMARGGLRGLTPMSHVAQVVPPSTWRVVGDRGDVAESFIPLDGSPRSMAILLETMRRMGVTPMAEGGITSMPVTTPGGDTFYINITGVPNESMESLARRVMALIRAESRKYK